MRFSIDATNGVPIYEQIVRQVTFAVAEGVLVSGQMVPSVRQLSTTLAINPNTIARAYQQLQSDDVLEALRGRGLVVRADAIARCSAARESILADRLRSVLSEAVHAGLTHEQLREMFEQQLQKL